MMAIMTSLFTISTPVSYAHSLIQTQTTHENTHQFMELVVHPLPPEVIHNILTFVDSPADLLSTSLANHLFCTLAMPELTHRSIRCCLDNDAVWVYLLANPAHAARVYALEVRRRRPSGYAPIMDPGYWTERIPERIPEGVWGEPKEMESFHDLYDQILKTEKSEKLLIMTLRVLVNLGRFTWSRAAPVVNQGRKIVSSLAQGDRVTSNNREYEEDVWTVLREHTHIRELRVELRESRDVKIWHTSVLSDLRNAHSLYESTIFRIKNLTHVELKIWYAPGEAVVNHANTGELLPGRIDISPIHTFLLHCPNLEHLTLSVHDHSYYGHNGNPYMNLTPTFASALWPRLMTLRLTDVTVSSEVMTSFLKAHPRLRVLAAFLSLGRPNLPTLPFTLSHPITPWDFLPELEEMYLPSKLARVVLGALSNPASVRAIRTLEPCDWSVIEDEGEWKKRNEEGAGRREADFQGLYDIWSMPQPSDGEDDPVYYHLRWRNKQEWETRVITNTNTKGNINLLKRMTGLRILAARNVQTLGQLGELVDATPQLEVVHLTGRAPNMDARFPPFMLPSPSDLISYISKWPQLVRLTGFFPLGRQEPALKLARELGAACPALKEVENACGMIVLVRDEQGQVVRLHTKEKEGGWRMY